MQKFFRIDAGRIEKPKMTPQGFLKVDGFATRTGVFKYRRADGTIRRELRLPEHVFNPDSLESMKGIPVTKEHPPVPLNAWNTKQFAVGFTRDTVERVGDFVKVSMVVTDKETIDSIMKGENEQLSCGYHCNMDETPGVHPEYGAYDSIQTNIDHNHLAAVELGRAGPEAKIKFDAAEAQGFAVMVLDADDPCADDEGDMPDAMGNPAGKMPMKKQKEKKDSEVPKSMSFSQPSEKKADEKTGEPIMKTIRIDGKEYQVEDGIAAVIQHKIDLSDSSVVEMKKNLDTLQGKFDALEAESKKKDSEIERLAKEGKNDQAAVKLAKARLDVEAIAKKHLGEKENFDSISTIDIKKKVLEKVYPGTKIDSASSDDYVNGMFAMLQSAPAKNDAQEKLDGQMGAFVGEKTTNLDAGAKELATFYADAWKNDSDKEKSAAAKH